MVGSVLVMKFRLGLEGLALYFGATNATVLNQTWLSSENLWVMDTLWERLLLLKKWPLHLLKGLSFLALLVAIRYRAR